MHFYFGVGGGVRADVLCIFHRILQREFLIFRLVRRAKAARRLKYALGSAATGAGAVVKA